MRYFVILGIIGISLLYSNLPEINARTIAPLSIMLEDDIIKQNSFITSDNGVPDITIQKGETVSFPLKVSSRGSEPLPVNFFHSIELATPDTHQATLPDMNIELDPFHMVLKPDEPQIMNVTITTLNHTQLGEHKIRLTAQHPQGDALLSTGFDVLVIDEKYENSNSNKYPVPGGGIIAHLYTLKTQIESGLSYEELTCNEGHVLIQKYDDSPACVTESTKLKLIERGWTGNSYDYGNPVPDDGIGSDRGNQTVIFTWNLEEHTVPITLNNIVLDYIRAEYHNQKILMYITMENKSKTGLVEFTLPKQTASLIFDNQTCTIFQDNKIEEFLLQVNQKTVGRFNAEYAITDDSKEDNDIILSITTPSDSSAVEIFSMCSSSLPPISHD